MGVASYSLTETAQDEYLDTLLAWTIHWVRSEVPQMPGDTRRRNRGHRRRIGQYVEGRDGDAQSERNAVDSGSCGTAVGAS